jgi:large subunit ribosomal protein L22
MTTQVTAYQKFIRQSPRKLRLVSQLIDKAKVDDALLQLKLSNKKGAKVLEKVLNQARANAVNNSQLNPKSLKVATVMIEEGPTFKRWQPVSRGRAHPILKRSSHIKITLEGESQARTS